MTPSEKNQKKPDLMMERLLTCLAMNLTLARNSLKKEDKIYTQDDLAQEAGISRVTIAQIESAKEDGDPRLSTIVALSQALKIHPLNLLMGKEEILALIESVLKLLQESGLIKSGVSMEDIQEKITKKFSPESVNRLLYLANSGIQKNMMKAAREGSQMVAEKMGHSGVGSPGAGIASGMLPGMGSVFGWILGNTLSPLIKSLSPRKEKATPAKKE